MKKQTQYDNAAIAADNASTHADATNTTMAHAAAYNAHCAALERLGKLSFVCVQLVRKHSETAMRHFDTYQTLKNA